MHFYHLDRLNTFPAQPTEQLLPLKTHNTLGAEGIFNRLYPAGMSKTGERYLNPFDVDTSNYDSIKRTCENYHIYSIEYALEVVRLLHFTYLPSRFESLFACERKEDVIAWADILSQNSMDIANATVKVIETSNDFFIGDSAWRDQPLTLKQELENGQDYYRPVFSPFAYHYWAIQYWSGIRTDAPKLEVLCRLPVHVVDSVLLSEFLRRLG